MENPVSSPPMFRQMTLRFLASVFQFPHGIRLVLFRKLLHLPCPTFLVTTGDIPQGKAIAVCSYLSTDAALLHLLLSHFLTIQEAV